MAVGFRFSGFHPSGGRSWLWPDDSAASHPAMRIVRACGHGIGWPYLLSASGGCAGFVSWLVLWHCFVNCLFVFFLVSLILSIACFSLFFPFAFRIEVAPKTGSTMLWRPNQIQFSGLRATNAASFFLSNLLEESPVLKKAQTVFPQIHTHIYVYTYKRCSR